MASTSSSPAYFSFVNDKITDAEKPQVMASTSSSVTIFSLVDDKIDDEEPQAMDSTSSSVTSFSLVNDKIEQPQATNSTSTSVTVTSPINETDVETEQLQTPDRRKSVDMKTYKKWLQMEIVGLSIIISIVLAVYFLPIFFFYKNQSSPEQEQPLPPMNSCVSAFPYTGDICKEELLSQKENFFLEGQSSDILVLRNISISAVEQIAAISSECREVGMPFLCLYFSGGICDKNGTHLIATRETCAEISNGVCYMEFKQAGLNISDCSVLPEEQNICSGISSGGPPSSYNYSKLRCREDFFCDSNNLCKPVCGSWSVYSSAVFTTFYAMEIICAVISSISSIAVFVITALHFKEVFVFPSVFVIYGNISISIHNFLIFFIGIIGRGVLCSSRNYIESAVEPTSICIIIGCLLRYAIMQFNICWVLHATSLFMIVKFPYKFRSLKKSTKPKYIHISCVIAILVIPLICELIAVLHAAGSNNSVKLGYTMISTISLFCTPKNSKIVFYTSALPSLLLVECGIALFIMTIWLIHKNYGLFKVKHSMSKNPFTFGTPEKKLLIIFSYYIVYHVIGYIYYILAIKNLKDGSTEFQKYFTCESNGHDPENPCDKSRLGELHQPVLEALTIIFLYLIPVVNLVFVFDFQQALSFFPMVSKKAKASFFSVC